MSTHFPDAATMRTALALAIRAPSVHNIQPWQWRVGVDSLHLYADPTRHLVHTDPDGRDLMVSCGAALHHCAVALAALGWQRPAMSLMPMMWAPALSSSRATLPLRWTSLWLPRSRGGGPTDGITAPGRYRRETSP